MPDQEPAIGQAATIEPTIGQSASHDAAGSKSSPSAWDLALTAAKQFASNFNPITMGESLFEGAQEHPLLASVAGPLGPAIYEGAKQQYQKAKDAYQQGRYSEAAGHTLAMALPLVGPMAANAGEEIGTDDPTTMAKGAGDAAAALAGPKVGEVAIAKAADVLPAIRATMAARQAGKMPERATRFAVDLPQAIPPTKSTPYTPIDTARATPFFAAEHAAMPVETTAQVAEAGHSISDQMADHMAQLVQAVPDRRIGADVRADVAAKLGENPDATHVTSGLNELKGYDLDHPTVEEADRIITSLNAKNRGVTLSNHWDTQTAIESDPRFAARYYAAEGLRNGMLDVFDDAGIPGVGDMRKDWASVLKITKAAERVAYAGDRKVGGTGATGVLASAARRFIPAGAAAAGAEVAGPAGAAAFDIAGRSLTNALIPGNQVRNALVAKAFQRLGLQQPPPYPVIPPTRPAAGLLTAPAKPLGSVPLRSSGPSATAPVVGGTSQPAVFGNRLQLPAGTANGELTRTNLGPTPDTSGGQLLDARPILVRDPKTGRFKRVYTAEPKGGGS